MTTTAEEERGRHPARRRFPPRSSALSRQCSLRRKLCRRGHRHVARDAPRIPPVAYRQPILGGPLALLASPWAVRRVAHLACWLGAFGPMLFKQRLTRLNSPT